MLEVETRRYFSCPNGCAHRFYVEHMFHQSEYWKSDGTRTVSTWFCDDCGRSCTAKLGLDGSCVVSPGARTRKDILVELELRLEPGQALKVRVKDYEYNGDTPEEAARHRAYYYNEHMCPVNVFQDVVSVFLDGDDDPHGVFQYVRVVPESEENDDEY